VKVIKGLLPVLMLAVGAFYSHYQFSLLPATARNVIDFMPILLTTLVAGLTFQFNRSRLFFYTLLVAFAYFATLLEPMRTDLGMVILGVLLPLLLLVFTLIAERGIFGLRAIPVYASIFLATLLSIYLLKTPAPWTNEILTANWLPVRYFDWTSLTQTAVASNTMVLLYFLVLYFVRPSPQMAAGFGIATMLIAELHFGFGDSSMKVFSSFALLMGLYAVTQESWRMAYMDELTGLPGRRALREKFRQLSGSYSVAMLDVDHFKKFNDTYGHDTGDAVLQMIAAKIRQLSGGGSSYRYGGEEFSIIFKGKRASEARPHLDALRETIAGAPFVINRSSRRRNDRKKISKNKKSVTVTVSIGVADSKAAATPWDALKQADKALYRAKENGRNRVCD